jgi:membrane-bound lytic murein transglycosylase B
VALGASGGQGQRERTRPHRLVSILLVAGSVLSATPVVAAGTDTGPGTQVVSAEQAVRAASSAADRLSAQPPAASAIDQLRHDLQLANAQFKLREAIRTEQEAVYAVAAQQPGQLPSIAGIGDAAEGLRSLWRMDGLDDFSLAHPRRTRGFAGAAPTDQLLNYYRAAGARTGVDWTYLAAINYIESDFGRNNGPSSAGALGPMQFLPATWDEYGAGGNIMSPQDSILAAGRFLFRNGAPEDYDRALLHYNHSQQYVAAVKHYAAAVRGDSFWLERFYYWNTFG